MVTIIDAKDLVMAVDPNIGRSRLIDYDYDDDDDSLQERMVMVWLSKEVGKQYFRVTGDFYLMKGGVRLYTT